MSFLHTISEEERRVLRKIVKQVHFKHYPKEFCTDYEADKMIASIGPEVVENLIRIGKDMKVDNL
jgi:hypothetical protein